ncbi:MAG: hypothetical protein AABZ83_12810, partial [candidate division NC10 bacterium]
MGSVVGWSDHRIEGWTCQAAGENLPGIRGKNHQKNSLLLSPLRSTWRWHRHCPEGGWNDKGATLTIEQQSADPILSSNKG